jgi:hypothetical protein
VAAVTAQYVRDYYKVPARRGGRITWKASPRSEPRPGTIVGFRGQYLRVRFDKPLPGHPIVTLHPTDNVRYLEEAAGAD